MSKAKQPLFTVHLKYIFATLNGNSFCSMFCYFFTLLIKLKKATGIFFSFNRHLFSDAQQAFCLALLTSFHRCLNPPILSRKIQEFILLPPTSLSIMLSVYTTETVEMSFQKGWMKHLWRDGAFNLKIVHCPTLAKDNKLNWYKT